MKLAGIEIGGTKLQVALGDGQGKAERILRYPIEARAGAESIRNSITKALSEAGQLDAIGVGFGGPINYVTGEVWRSYQVEGWKGFNFSKWLADTSNAKVFVENDANAAALGESVLGAGSNERVVFYVTMGSGVGGGLVIDKQIYHGRLPGEAEFGHVRIDLNGKTVESSCSGWAVNQKVKAAVARDPNGKLAQYAAAHPGVEAKALLPAFNDGDRSAKTILDDTTFDLAYGLSHVVHLFHPDAIVMGGGLSQIGDLLRKSVEGKLKLFLMDAFLPGPKIAISALGIDSVPKGALLLAARKIKESN